MKRITIIILILCIFTLVTINLFGTQQVSSFQLVNLMQNDEVYYNLFITMLSPYIEDAVADYYSEYMTYPPIAAPYDFKFTSIEKEHGLNYSYIVELELHPYVGPHLSVGKDRLTFKVKLNGVYIDKFEHLESHELPSHYQHMIKKKFPNT